MEIIKCACGCGTEFEAKDKYGRLRKYISGHNTLKKYDDPTQYKREWNHRNRKSRFLYKKKYIKALKEKLIAYKGNKCADCEYVFDGKNHTVFDLHHLNPYDKDFEISKLIGNRAWQSVLNEADKCDMLCANCHRLRHSKEEDEKLDEINHIDVISPKKTWRPEEDLFILEHNLEESKMFLGRSIASIKSRLKKIKSNKIK